MIHELVPVFGYQPEDIKIEYIGTKPGEKMYEELMNTEEVRRASELERYFAVIPPFSGLFREIKYEYPDTVATTVTNPYHSDNEVPLRQDQLLTFLKENGLLIETVDEQAHPAERYWPER
jgi:FlaA1/EpsC-like NDP-sugar epimerase